jgi:hypothetical protein
VSDKHVEMRDRYMHGREHRYPSVLPDEYLQDFKDDVAYAKSMLPVLQKLQEL